MERLPHASWQNTPVLYLKKKKKKRLGEEKSQRINSPSLAMLEKDMEIRHFLALSYSQDKCHLSFSSHQSLSYQEIALIGKTASEEQTTGCKTKRTGTVLSHPVVLVNPKSNMLRLFNNQLYPVERDGVVSHSHVSPHFSDWLFLWVKLRRR